MNKLVITTMGLFALSPIAESVANELQQQNADIETISVEGRRNQANTEVSVETEKLLKVAGIDNDPLSAVFSLPGVVYAGGDDGGEPAIRGSSPDDNAFYIDDMPVSYIFHMFGDSIFNENLVRDFQLHPAAFNSSYSNATGGVFDVQMRDPRDQKLTTIVDASLLKTGIMVEGGVTDDQAFYFSYRRSLMHLFLPEGEEDEGYTIFKAPISDDYQGKYQWLIGDDQKLTFTVAGASDEGGINISEASEQGRIDPESVGDLKLKNRFDSQSLSWQFFGEDSQILQVSIAHTKEKENQSYGQGQYIQVDEEQYNARLSYKLDWMASHQLRMGVDFQQTDVDYSFDAIPYYCTEHDADCQDFKGERIQDADSLTNKDIGVYINDLWLINDAFELEAGLRAEYNDYTEQSFVHPRVALSYFPTPQLTFNAKAGTYSRFPDVETVLRKVGNPELSAPKAKHFSLGMSYELNDVWSASIDVYHKSLSDLPMSVDQDGPNADLRYTDDLSGSAHGVELVINRARKDGWYGWASLSWAKSDRTDDLTGIKTPYYLDTPLMANVVANYELNERWDFGIRFTLRSGQRYTPIVGLRENPDHQGHFLPNYGELNSETLPAYHRLDVQANYNTTIFGYDAQWSFATINTYGRKNVSGYYYAPDGNETIDNYEIEAEEGIGIFPSIGLKVTF